ncbi:MAG: putative sugar nucleotidyl transferase [Bacteroidales bacterium]|nr:putative sugar nucleotidyl transferase [Bacteroidales bacterium]
MNIILFDGQIRDQLLPLSFTRPIAEFRFGILTIKEKWERVLPGNYSVLTQKYLEKKYPLIIEDDNIFIAGNVTPSLMLSAEIELLNKGQVLMDKDRVIAFRGTIDQFNSSSFFTSTQTQSKILSFDRLYDLFLLNETAIEDDFRLITEGRQSEPISESVRIIGEKYFEDGTPKIFIEKGAKIECAILNLSNGPVYIGQGAEVQEGSVIRAPFAMCEHSVANMNTKIYGATTLGPYCKVGGELNNVIMFGYSNKAHEGFLGNAVVGEWCNIGAGTNASNLKNDYSEIKLWSYPQGKFLKTGLQFCGLIMGDHSKTGINSMINTATILGVGVNIHGSGFPRNFVPSFSEGGASGFSDVNLVKFFQTASKMMERRGMILTNNDREIFEYINREAENYK